MGQEAFERTAKSRRLGRRHLHRRVSIHLGPEGKLRVVRKKGERYKPEHIQHRCRRPEKEDQKRFHVWAGVGYNFISPLIFSDADNSNGKMSQKVYRDQILEPVVGQWIRDGCDFTLEEDNNSGHSTHSTNNPAARWNMAHDVRIQPNAAYSPDPAIIETCWSSPKHITRKLPDYDDETTKDLILEGWDRLNYDGVNKMVHSMPQRLRDVLYLKGQIWRTNTIITSKTL